VTGWLVPSAGQKTPVQPGWYLPGGRSRSMKTGVFRQVMDLKIQRKNLGGAFRLAQLSRGRWAVPLNLPLRGQITCNLLLEIFAQNLFVLQLLPR